VSNSFALTRRGQEKNKKRRNVEMDYEIYNLSLEKERRKEKIYIGSI